MESGVRISIVIPTCNAGPLLDRVLDALDAQEPGFDREIIAVDSGSTDGTVERLTARGARVHQIRPAEFNHGLARNAGVALASGELAVLLVQDAVPVSTTWLADLVKPLRVDPRIAGSFARQRPWPHASRVTSYYSSRWVAAAEDARTVGPLAGEVFEAMSPAERHHICAFDNVCSCIRVGVWRAHPFRRTPIAEDLQWAREVLASGYRLAYVPDAIVWHSHERSVQYELQRTYLVHQQLQLLFGLCTIPTWAALLRSVMTTLPLHIRLAITEPRARTRALCRGAGLAVALPLGQYLGARSSREGRELLRVQGI
jgi:rhamnosyltransferase